MTLTVDQFFLDTLAEASPASLSVPQLRLAPQSGDPLDGRIITSTSTPSGKRVDAKKSSTDIGSSSPLNASASHARRLSAGGAGVTSPLKTCAVTHVVQRANFTITGYEDGSVLLHHYIEGGNGSIPGPAGSSMGFGQSFSTMGVVDELGSHHHHHRHSHHLNDTSASLRNGSVQAGKSVPWATQLLPFDFLNVQSFVTAPAASSNNSAFSGTGRVPPPALGSDPNGDFGATVRCVDVRPVANSHVAIAVAYDNAVLVMTESLQAVRGQTSGCIGGQEPQPPRCVLFRGDYLQKALQQVTTHERVAAEESAPLTGNRSRKASLASNKDEGNAAKPGPARGRRGGQNTANAASGPLRIQSITLSPCSRYLAVSFISPALTVLLLELPPRLVDVAVPPSFLQQPQESVSIAGPLFTSCPITSLIPEVLLPYRAISSCVYRPSASSYNQINHKHISELVPATPMGAQESINDRLNAHHSSSSPLPLSGPSSQLPLFPKLDVFSDLHFLVDSSLVTTQLVVVYVNSPVYCRMPVSQAASTFSTRAAEVSHPEPPSDGKDGANSGRGGKNPPGKGGAAIPQPQAAGKKVTGAKGNAKGSNQLDSAPPKRLVVESFDGVLWFLAPDTIRIAAVNVVQQIIVLGTVGGCLYVLNLHRAQAACSAVPPPDECPREWQVVRSYVSIVSLSVQTSPTPPPSEGGSGESAIHVVAGTALLSDGRPPLYGAASIYVRLDEGGISTSNIGSPVSPDSAAKKSEEWRSLYLCGLPSAVCGCLLADPLPFCMIFLCPYTRRTTAYSSPTRMNSGVLENGGGGAMLGGMEITHCLVWDTRFNSLLASLPFPLHTGMTMKERVTSLSFSASVSLRQSKQQKTRTGSLSASTAPLISMLKNAGKPVQDSRLAESLGMSVGSTHAEEEWEQCITAPQHTMKPFAVLVNRYASGGVLTAHTGGLMWLQDDSVNPARCSSALEGGDGGGSCHTMTLSEVEAAAANGGASAGSGGAAPVTMLRPHFWSFTALLHTLYPSFLAYFPDVSIARIGQVLRRLTHAQRTDSVELMNAAIPTPSPPPTAHGGRNMSVRPPSGRGSRAGRLGSAASSGTVAQRRSPSLSSRGAPELDGLCDSNADAFPAVWLTGASGGADWRRRKLQRCFHNFTCSDTK